MSKMSLPSSDNLPGAVVANGVSPGRIGAVREFNRVYTNLNPESAGRSAGELASYTDQFSPSPGPAEDPSRKAKGGFTSFADFENLKFPLIWNLGFGESLLQPLLSGGYNRAFLSETEQAKLAAESNLKSAVLQVDREVYTDYANTSVSQQQIDLATKADQEARENLAFAEGRYSAGVGNIIELTDAELLAATAGAQVVTARYNYQLAYGQLEVAAGKDPSD